MKPPILQTAWHNQVFCPPALPGTSNEAFVVGTLSPDGGAVLWLEFRLVGAPAGRSGEACAEVAATWVASPGAAPRTVRQRYPIERVGIDPERAGVGIGECDLAEGCSSGRISDADGSIAWDFRWAPQAPYLPLAGSDGGPLAGSTPHQWCAGAGGAAAAGRLEIWPGHGRHISPQRTQLEGWQVVQFHRWHGPGVEPAQALPLSALWAASAATQASPALRLLAVALPSGGLRGRRQVLLARLWRGEEVWPFDGPAQRQRGATSEVSGPAWSFTAQGPQGHLACRLDIPATCPPSELLADANGRRSRRLLAHQSGLEAELRPLGGGAPERLRFALALCEMLSTA